MENYIYLYEFALCNSLAKICSALFMAVYSAQQNSKSIYFNKQANTWRNAFFFTLDFVKALKSVLTNLDLKNLLLHWVSSVAKPGDTQRCQKISSKIEYQNGNHNAIKTSIQSWNSTENRLMLSADSFHCGEGEPPYFWGLWTLSESKCKNTHEKRGARKWCCCAARFPC